MTEHFATGSPPGRPSTRVLLLCAGLLVAGYVVALLRGPMPAHEVRVVVMPSGGAVPSAGPSAE